MLPKITQAASETDRCGWFWTSIALPLAPIAFDVVDAIAMLKRNTRIILFFHGGGGQSNLQALKNNLLTGAIQTRFLEAGYLTIASTRRPYWN